VQPSSSAIMCGILAVLGSHDYSPTKRARILELSRRLRHRGPDWSGLFVDEQACCYLSHERLAIIDPTSGDQPLYNGNKSIVVAVNGEIYNHEALKKTMKKHDYHTQSDCEVIAHLVSSTSFMMSSPRMRKLSSTSSSRCHDALQIMGFCSICRQPSAVVVMSEEDLE
jgi:asparagine synthetase B (glutamine-hydrolysing)